MAKRTNGKPHAQGTIERRGNSLRVKVYAGTDPLTGRRLYLRESTTDEAEAKRIMNRFRSEVDENRNARTRAVFRVAIAEWLNSTSWRTARARVTRCTPGGISTLRSATSR